MEQFITVIATWPWPWIGPSGIPSCITHRPLTTYQIPLRSDENFFEGRISIFFQVQSHVTQKQGQIRKIWPKQIYILPLVSESAVIYQLSRKMVEEMILKMEEFLTFNATWPWPWIGPCGTLSGTNHWPLPTHQISLESEKLFVDGCTYVHTDIRTY